MASRPGVLCRGLPYQADADDVRQFFKSLDIPDRNIEVMESPDGLGSGVAYVALRDEAEVKRALLMDHNHIGSRYIDVLRADDDRVEKVRSALDSGATRNEVHRICGGEPIRRNFVPMDRPVRDRSPVRFGSRILNSRTHCGYFRGMPNGCMYKEVRQFFKGCLIPKNSIHLIRDSSNRFRGDGYVEFANSEELKKALQLDGDRMEGSVIRVDPCSEEEMHEMMGFTERRERSPVHLGGGGRGSGGDFYYQGHGGYSSRNSGGGRGGGGYSRGGGGAYRDRDSGYYNDSPTYGGDWDPYEESRSRHGSYSSRYHSSEPSYDHPHDRKAHTPRQGRGSQAPFRTYRDQRRYDSPHMVSYPHGSSSPERRVLRVQGLPGSASAADVMAFFRDFSVQYEDVRLQCHEDGTPNGRAFVTFPTQRLAESAYHNLNRQYIRGHPVELLIV